MADVADLLATKWIPPSQFESQYGIICRTGAFSGDETRRAKDEIERYCQSRGFWARVARAVPSHGVKSVYDHVRCAYDPMARQGKWDGSVDDQLRFAVQKFGDDWESITKGNQRRGTWSEREEEDLLCVMRELGQEGRMVTKLRGFWPEVSKRMGGVRTPQQCQNKWFGTLEPKLLGSGKKRVWGKDDERILITKVASFDVQSEDDLD
ncbi:hypothetical protein BC834DRAFT_975659 [Gloeopeniophorella convolvens]|nr:hypothetical protein BC834DRAFT_975659 [Gloeopeniophorella convolvens]